MLRVVVLTATFSLLVGCTGVINSTPSEQIHAPVFPVEYQSFRLESLYSVTAITATCDQFIDKLVTQKRMAENSELMPTQASFYTLFDAMLVSVNNFTGGLRLISDSFDQPA